MTCPLVEAGGSLSGSSGLVNQIVGGWRLNGILTLQGGQPFTIPCDITTAAGMSCVALFVPGRIRLAVNTTLTSG